MEDRLDARQGARAGRRSWRPVSRSPDPPVINGFGAMARERGPQSWDRAGALPRSPRNAVHERRQQLRCRAARRAAPEVRTRKRPCVPRSRQARLAPTLPEPGSAPSSGSGQPLHASIRGAQGVRLRFWHRGQMALRTSRSSTPASRATLPSFMDAGRVRTRHGLGRHEPRSWRGRCGRPSSSTAPRAGSHRRRRLGREAGRNLSGRLPPARGARAAGGCGRGSMPPPATVPPTILRTRREIPTVLRTASTAGLAEDVERRSDLRELVDDIGRRP